MHEQAFSGSVGSELHYDDRIRMALRRSAGWGRDLVMFLERPRKAAAP